MPRQLLASSLRSRAIRTQVTSSSGQRGVRTIGRNSSDSGGAIDTLRNFAGGFLARTTRFAGWLLQGIIQGAAISFVSAYQALVQVTSFVYNFDWNISDQSIDALVQSTRLILAGQRGEAFGQALGFLACGVVPSAGVFAFNEMLGLYLLKEVGEEALDELAGQVQIIAQTSFRLKTRDYFIKSYKNVRHAIKRYVRTRSEQEQTTINRFFGGNITQAIEAWGEENTRPWSFRLAVENVINSIQDPIEQEFWEEAHDGFLEGCLESGYVIANGLDTWVLQQNQGNNLLEPQNNLVEVQPDRNAPEERLLFSGNNRSIKNQIISSLNNFQLVDNRDVGQIIGEPLLDSVRKPPVSLSLRIYLRGNQSPPWIGIDGNQSKRAQVTIPNINRARLDYDRIRRAVGGSNGYLWGRFYVEANLDDGNKITFYAGSETEGENVAERLIELSNSSLTTINITEEKRAGSRVRFPGLFKQTQRIYPASISLINQQQILRIDEGIATTRGQYRRRRYLLPIYDTRKPDEFDVVIAELSRRSE